MVLFFYFTYLLFFMVWPITYFHHWSPFNSSWFSFYFYVHVIFVFLARFWSSIECVLSRACYISDVAVILLCMSALCVVMLLLVFHTAKTCETHMVLHDGRSNWNIFIHLPSQISWSDVCMPRSEIEFYSCFVYQNTEVTGSG